MSLHRGTSETAPKGSIALTEEQAKEFQFHIIYNWKPERDVWPFHFGFSLLGATGALSGVYINNHYRRRLKLLSYGRLSTYLPIVVIPAMASAFFHQHFVTFDILIQKTPCPVCVEVRSALIHVASSVVYPAVLAPLAGFMMASKYFTYKLPSFLEDPKGVFNVWKKMTKPIGNTLFSIAIAQTLAAMFVTYLEARSYYTVQEKLTMQEEEFTNEL